MMVEQMVNSKFSKYDLGKCGSLLATHDKQPLVSIKKTALRDLQNNNRTAFPYPFGNFSALRETKSTENATQVLGAKSLMPDGLLSPTGIQSPGCTNVNQQLVYARRGHISDKNQSADYLRSEQFSNKRAITQPQAKIKDPNSDGISAFASIPVNYTLNSSGTLLPDSLWKDDHRQLDGLNSVVPCSEDSRVIGDQHWRERFIQLQKYLKYCDNSNQEAYVQMVQSFNSDERSRHAVGLEKRAIHLLLEEGREIQRMKVLNVLGKSAPNIHPATLVPKVKLEK